MSSGSESPPPAAKPLSLRRWSQRKHEATRAEPKSDAAATPAAPGAKTSPSTATGPTPPAVATSATALEVPLPPVETLTPDSDFTAFFDVNTSVGETVKRAALKQLLRDPRFNVMDGLDTYIDDYTREDPIPESMLKRLVQARAFRDPNPEELAEEKAQRDAAIAQAQGGAAADLPPAAGAPARPADATTPATSPPADPPPHLPLANKP